MFEILGIVVGLGIVAISPTVPILRDITKAVVKGGIIAVDTTKEALNASGEHWADLVAEAQAEKPPTNPKRTPASMMEVEIPISGRK